MSDATPLSHSEFVDLRDRRHPARHGDECEVCRFMATIEHLMNHVPDQKHNEMAIRTLQDREARLQAKVDMYEAALKDKFGPDVLERFDNPQHLKSW